MVTLAAGPENEIVGAIIDTRVVYNRCGLVRVNDPAGGFNTCDQTIATSLACKMTEAIPLP